MAPQRSSGRPKGPAAGSILTGMIVGEAKKGVLVELGSSELVLPRSRYGTAADRIIESGYGDALTVEVVDAPGGAGGRTLDRVAIERSIRQPRPITGTLRRRGSGFLLEPADGADAFAVFVLDRFEPDALASTERRWLVGAPHRGIRFIEPDA